LSDQFRNTLLVIYTMKNNTVTVII